MVDTSGIGEAAQKLAPLYGMTYEEFINQPVNPGFKGLMPDEDCAEGLAYCIVNAGDYQANQSRHKPYAFNRARKIIMARTSSGTLR